MFRAVLLNSGAAVALLLASTGQAQAQATDDYGVAEVVVTAQKRAENVQDVPISVTAFSGETLEAAGVQDVRDLRRIAPNLNLATSAQQTNTRVMIRGIGTAGNTAIEPSVASFVDGIYIPRVGSLLAGLNDISSVEVLRGPQGTLFGRNASMGAIILRTTEPQDSLSSELAVSAGNYGRRRGSAIINVPINDTLAGRVAVLGYRADGFGRNDLTGKRLGRNEGFSVRGALKWEITPELTWVLRGDHQNINGDGYNVVTVVSHSVTPQARTNWQTRLDPDGAGPLTGDLPYLDSTYSRRVRQESEGDLEDYQTGVASDLTWELPSGFQLKLLSGYRDWHNEQYQYSTGNIPLGFQTRLGTFDSQSHSEELQILSPSLLADRFSFVAGLYYFTEEYDIGQVVDLHEAFCEVFIRNTGTAAALAACRADPKTDAALVYFDQTTDSYAGYFQGTYNLTQQLALTGGIRYSKDEKEGAYRGVRRNRAVAGQAPEVTPLALEEDKITYRANVTYRPVDNIMMFASYATGFKSGGFDASPGASPVGAANRTFNPESTENIELGVKSELFQRRLIANATLFRTDITEYQFRSYDGSQFRVRNNGEVRQQGLELDTIARPIRPLTLTFSVAYLDSQYLDFRGAPQLPGLAGTQDLTGERLPYSPKWQGAASAQYVGELGGGMTWVARGDMSFTSQLNLSASGDNNPDALQPGYQLFAARVAIRGPDERWELALAGQNLTNETFCVGIFNQPSNGPFGLNKPTGGTVLRCTLNEPRTITLEAKARF